MLATICLIQRTDLLDHFVEEKHTSITNCSKSIGFTNENYFFAIYSLLFSIVGMLHNPEFNGSTT